MGLYNYDRTILDNLEIPKQIDRETLNNLLLMDTADLEISIPAPSYLKLKLGYWSKALLPGWQRMADALELEYNPIENYDRFEQIVDVTEGEHDVTRSSSGNSTQDAHSENGGGDTTTLSRSAYNDGFEGAEQTETELGSHLDNSIETEQSEKGTESGTNKTTMTHNNHTHGNIGVTTSQQMLEEEFKISYKNVYDRIIDDFKQEFCILVY